MKHIRIRAMIGGTTGVFIPHLNLRRVWARKGAVLTIPADVLEQAFYDIGFENLLREGSLYIEDQETRIKLGLEKRASSDKEAEDEGSFFGTEEITPVIPLTDEYIQTLLFKTPIKKFEEALGQLSRIQKEELANEAIRSELTDYNRCQALQQATGKDVMKIVLQNKEDQEKEKREKQG